VENLLPGGYVNPVVRIGDTVRRVPHPRDAFVHELLAHLETRDFAGAPRFLGTDDEGREILSFIDGHVAWEDEQPAEVGSDASLRAVALLLRELHDLTAGTTLAGSADVVCHNDLSPKNTVYRDLGEGLVPVAFIDWDLAAPGKRIHDVAHVCWQFLDLGQSVTDVPEAERRLRLISDSYGLRNRRDLVETILWWQERSWRGIVAQAEAGDPAMRRLNDSGAPVRIRSAHRWVLDHRRALEAGLR
jgi:Phosphotransferase enzyme family